MPSAHATTVELLTSGSDMDGIKGTLVAVTPAPAVGYFKAHAQSWEVNGGNVRRHCHGLRHLRE